MKVCVDPGHGMANATPGVFDPGAVHRASGTRDADVVLGYGLELKNILEARGVQVFMTRDNNTSATPVRDRASRAETAGCDIFVSLHLNSFNPASVNGVEALYRDDPDEQLATDMRDAMKAATGLKARDIKKRPDLAVLTFDGRAVLLEIGFVSNTNDRTTVLKPSIRTAVCKAVADVLQAV
jgi:N-acetylmuramoyl-L-alanine amidase